MRLSPVVRNVTLFNPRKKKGAARNPRLQCTHTCPGTRTLVCNMCTATIDDNLCSELFVVQATHVEEHGNMSLENNEHFVKIPVFINKSIIKKGQELLWFVEKDVTEKPTPEPQALQLKPNKRAKVESK